MSVISFITVAPPGPGLHVRVTDQHRRVLRQKIVGNADVPGEHVAAKIQPVGQIMAGAGALKGHGHVRRHAVGIGRAVCPVQARGHVDAEHLRLVGVHAPDQRRILPFRGAVQPAAKKRVHPQIRPGQNPPVVGDGHAGLQGLFPHLPAVLTHGRAGFHRHGDAPRLGVSGRAAVAVAAVAAPSAGEIHRFLRAVQGFNHRKDLSRSPLHQLGGGHAGFAHIPFLRLPHLGGRQHFPHPAGLPSLDVL